MTFFTLETLSFGDMIKKSVLEGFNTESISIATIVLSLIVAFAAGLFVLLIHRLTKRSPGTAGNFEISLLMLSVVSSLIVLTITSNLALSLGMVGALSIIRFRTAVKDPADTAFMFWAVAVGITAGARFYVLTLVGSLIVGFLTFIAIKMLSASSRGYILVVRASTEQAANYVTQFLEQNNIRHKLSSLSSSNGSTEVIFEISITRGGTKLVSAVRKIPDITEVSLIDCRNTPV